MPINLFGVEEPDPPAPNRGRRETYRQRQARLLAEGLHPMTALPLANNGKTCKTCAKCYAVQFANRFYKCELMRHTPGGLSTDIKVRWPACSAYEPEADGEMKRTVHPLR